MQRCFNSGKQTIIAPEAKKERLKEIPVLFENTCCLVLNKPAGLAVQGGEGIKFSLDSILSEKIKPRPLLVHRLDRDTSGVILVAKTREAAGSFSALFASSRAITNLYLGICSGVVEPAEGAIKLSLDVRGKGRVRVKKESETFYKLLSSGELGGQPCSLLELKLGTGRMHQIRRHLALSGHPLLGDDKYGDFALNKKLKAQLGLKALCLHASRLVIPPLPGLLDGLDVTAEPPESFSQFLERMKH
jgi:23S rRNA pseudouridine955/2504/2580 synthase